MNETTFENAVVGDRVWNFEFGWGRIVAIRAVSEPLRPILVDYTTSPICHYYSSLGCNEFGRRILLWNEIKFEAPPRPKRKVKKVVEGWVNIYKSSGVECDYETGEFVHATMDGAIRKRGYAIYLGEPLFIRHEYEVEE